MDESVSKPQQSLPTPPELPEAADLHEALDMPELVKPNESAPGGQTQRTPSHPNQARPNQARTNQARTNQASRDQPQRSQSPRDVTTRDLLRRIDACMLFDRRRLAYHVKQLERELHQRRGKPHQTGLPRPTGQVRAHNSGTNQSRNQQQTQGRNQERDRFAWLQEQIDHSIARARRRRAALPTPRYPMDLPVSARRAEIAEAIRDNQVVILCGETGSGKTTQLPKICMELGRGALGIIGHTQPRRIAATSVAKRLSDELSLPLGREIGYKIRFGDKSSPDNLCRVMTDGVLLAETQGDRLLETYDTIIIDEAHERSLNIDFLLGYIRMILPKRPELKVIVTSATIDTDRFSKHFSDAPILTISGRTYPVETRYRMPMLEDGGATELDMQDSILAAVDECAGEGNGDILIFLSGEREIRETAENLAKHRSPGSERTAILPLYSRLSGAEQQRVFEPYPGRKIVLATNVAETSLTVPGIRYVIDPGLARISRYSTRTKVQRLEVEPVSQASANQRKGRCGRVGPGICIRLYEEADFTSRPEYTDPEIQRSNLAAVILRMKSLRLGIIEDFPFIEPPDSRSIRDAHETLSELGALDPDGHLTKLGHDLAKFPLDPRIARIILGAQAENCLSEGLIIAAALSLQDPRERPHEAQDAADAAHARMRDQTSDYMSYLLLWDAFGHERKNRSGGKLRAWCRDNYLSYMRMREWGEVHGQLLELAQSIGLKPSGRAALPEAIHRAVLSGLLSNIGSKTEDGDYAGVRGTRFNVFPGSALFRKSPKWVVAAEIVRTTRVYARTVAGVEPEWIERLAGHLIKKNHADPQWSAHDGRVLAVEKGTLFGLELYKGRKVHFGVIDPVVSRELFIHHALVEGDSDIRGSFVEHNDELVERMRELETRMRRRNVFAEAEMRYAFYDARVPREVCTTHEFQRWRKIAERSESRILFMKPEDLVTPGIDLPGPHAFPDVVDAAGSKLRVTYTLAPSEDRDGVTTKLPVEALARADTERFAWLVPGLVEEKIEAMVRGLPKQVRRLLPTPQGLAKECVGAIAFAKGSLAEQVAEWVTRTTKVAVTAEMLREAPLPDHLRMRYEVVDADGKTLAAGRDLRAIRREIAGKLGDAAVAIEDERWSRAKVTVWDFPDLPETVRIDRNGLPLIAHPALHAEGGKVSLRLFDSREAAGMSHRGGVRRLAILATEDAFKRGTRFVPGIDQIALRAAALGQSATIRLDVEALIADRAFLGDAPTPLTKAEFDYAVDRGMRTLNKAIEESAALATQVYMVAHAVQLELSREYPAAWRPTVLDMAEQLSYLLAPGFLGTVPWRWLTQYPRYMQAMLTRLKKLPGPGLARDQKCMSEVSPYWSAWKAMRAARVPSGAAAEAAEMYRWMVEEYRVSLFAQELRTVIPVSAKRLQEQLSLVTQAH